MHRCFCAPASSPHALLRTSSSGEAGWRRPPPRQPSTRAARLAGAGAARRRQARRQTPTSGWAGAGWGGRACAGRRPRPTWLGSVGRWAPGEGTHTGQDEKKDERVWTTSFFSPYSLDTLAHEFARLRPAIFPATKMRSYKRELECVSFLACAIIAVRGGTQGEESGRPERGDACMPSPTHAPTNPPSSLHPPPLVPPMQASCTHPATPSARAPPTPPPRPNSLSPLSRLPTPPLCPTRRRAWPRRRRT